MITIKLYTGIKIVFDDGYFYVITNDTNIILTNKHKTFTELWVEFSSIRKGLVEMGYLT